MAMVADTGDTDMETDMDMEMGTDMEMAMDMTIAVGDFRGLRPHPSLPRVIPAPRTPALGAGFSFLQHKPTAPVTVGHDCRPIGNHSLQR